MKFIHNFFDLLFPNLCIVCKNHLFSNEKYLCLYCIENINFVPVSLGNNSLMEKQLYGRFLFKNVNALLYYEDHSITQQLLHQLKYKKQQDIGNLLAHWTYSRYKNHSIFKTVDGIIKVPIHAKRLKERGYNQLDSFTEKISLDFKIPIYENIVVRKLYSRSQTSKNRQGRNYQDNIFSIQNSETLKGKHLLIIDDVITTGSTIAQIANLLLEQENTQVSVFTFALTK